MAIRLIYVHMPRADLVHHLLIYSTSATGKAKSALPRHNSGILVPVRMAHEPDWLSFGRYIHKTSLGTYQPYK